MFFHLQDPPAWQVLGGPHIHPAEADGPRLDPHVHCQTCSAGVNQYLSWLTMSLPMPCSLSGRRSPDVGSGNRHVEATHTPEQHLEFGWSRDLILSPLGLWWVPLMGLHLRGFKPDGDTVGKAQAVTFFLNCFTNIVCIFSLMCAFFLSCPSECQCFNLKGLTGKMISRLRLDFLLLSIVSSSCGLNEPCESLRCGQRAETNGLPSSSLLYLSLSPSLSLSSTHLSICVFWRAPSLCARQSSARYLRCSPCGRALSRDDAKLSTVQHLHLRVKLKRSLCLSLSFCLSLSLMMDLLVIDKSWIPWSAWWTYENGKSRRALLERCFLVGITPREEMHRGECEHPRRANSRVGQRWFLVEFWPKALLAFINYACKVDRRLIYPLEISLSAPLRHFVECKNVEDSCAHKGPV